MDNDFMILHYDMLAISDGRHPQQVFNDDGLEVIQSEPSSLGDCWFIKIKTKDNLPSYYRPSKWKFADQPTPVKKDGKSLQEQYNELKEQVKKNRENYNQHVSELNKYLTK